MRCHYEILHITKDADLANIKSAYKKSALKWHPDKNLSNIEYAKEQFQLVQQAYEVLSDPQERAWYDKHREQILRSSNSEFQDNCLDVFQYFTPTCYKGYEDDDKGFYTVYRHVFDQIIKEDLEFIDHKEEFCDIPRFGDSTSDYDEVVGPFYAYWSSYCTKKSYVWLNPYDITERRDRRVLKMIEKENKRVRQKAKRERNEEIRNLVGFIRKRDKRVQEHTKLIEAKIVENRQKQKELSEQRRLERKKQLNESGAQAEWAKFDNIRSELEEIEKNLAEQFGEEFSEEENENVTNLYCVACNKIFKTSKALENHESSKRHKENVETLKEMMFEDEVVSEETDEEYLTTENSQSIASNDDAGVDIGSEEAIDENEDLEELVAKSKKQKRRNKKANIILLVNDVDDTNCDIDVNKTIDSDDFTFDSPKKQTKKCKRQNKNAVEQKEKEIQAKCTNSSKKKLKENPDEEFETNHCCVSCKLHFPSKNKLFDHLRKTEHGVYLPKNKNKKGTKEN